MDGPIVHGVKEGVLTFRREFIIFPRNLTLRPHGLASSCRVNISFSILSFKNDKTVSSNLLFDFLILDFDLKRFDRGFVHTPFIMSPDYEISPVRYTPSR